jgi:succinyl-diaminopimelate desuccinylase
MFQDIYKRIDGYSDFVIDLQKRLIAISSIGPENGGEGEYKKALALEGIVKELFGECQMINVPDSRVPSGLRPNIAAKMKGKDTLRTIWIMAHLDTVTPGNPKEWNTDPFQAVVKDGKIYGLGSEDNHQGIISPLLTAKALKEAGVIPLCNFGILLTSDEEFTADWGCKHLIKNNKELFGPNDTVIVPDEGNSEGSEIEVSEKSLLWFKIKINGKQIHAAMPDKGVNSLKAAAHLICKAEGLYKVFTKKDSLFSPAISTFEPTMKEANVGNINTIPGEDILYYDCRLLPDLKYEDVVKQMEIYFREIEEDCGVKITYELPLIDLTAPGTPVNSTLVKKLTRAIEEVRKIKPHHIGIGGRTVATYFRAAGLPCVAWATLDQMAHQPNEYCVIKNLLDDAKVLAHVFTSNVAN